MKLLEIKGLTARYNAGDVLKGLDLTVEEGEIVALLGSNGAGKSTTLRSISGLVPHIGGSITFAGQPILGLKTEAIAKLGLAHVPEGRRLFPGLTVRDNILLGSSNRSGVARSQLEREADELLADFRHRKLVIEHEATGARLRPSFADAGWIADRNAVMQRTGPGRPHADVEEVELRETHALRIEWYLDYDPDPEVQRAVAEAQDRVSAKRGMRAFVVRGDSGAPVGFTTLAVGADAVEIDQLYVTPDARSGGIGTRLVEAALAAGGRDTAWVIADDEGRARALYERLGFRTACRLHEFLRQP